MKKIILMIIAAALAEYIVTIVSPIAGAFCTAAFVGTLLFRLIKDWKSLK